MRNLRLLLYYLIPVFFVLIILYILGLSVFWRAVPHEQSIVPSRESVIVFTGGSKRVDAAFSLIEVGFPGPVLITGVNENVSEHHLLRHVPPHKRQHITLDYTAKTTRGNVHATQLWLQANDISSFTLVTSFYHIPRSVMLLQRSGIPSKKIEIYPVFPQKMPLSSFIREYHKYLLTYIELL